MADPWISRISILRPTQWPFGQKKIILTFDDGPSLHDHVSEKLLDVLDRHPSVKAVFCVIGINVDEAPHIVKRAYESGHEIAIHTYTHSGLSLFNRNWLDDEIRRSVEAIRKATGDAGYTPRYFRSPFGLVTGAVSDTLEKHRVDCATVNFFINDVRVTTEGAEAYLAELKARLLKDQGGATVLHEQRYLRFKLTDIEKRWLPAAVDDLIRWAQAEGFEFVTYADRPDIVQ